MGLNVEIGGPSVIADSFNSSAGQTSVGQDMQMAANNTPVTPSQLFPVKMPATRANAGKVGLG